MSLPRKTMLIILAFFAIYVIWGSTYLLNKIVVTEVAPLYLASIRFTAASILIFIIAKILQLNLAISKRQFLNNIFAGFLFLVYGNGVFVWALRYVDSGFGALEASIQPLMVLALMRMIDGKKIKTSSIIGISLGIIGMYLLVSQQQLTYQENSLIGIIMIFTCVISWSFGSLFVARAELGPSYFVNTGYQMLSSGILLSLISLLLGETWLSPLQWSGSAQLSMGLLIIFGSIVAFTAFNFLLKEVSTEKVSTSAYVNPVIALILGWYVLDEHITMQSIIAAIILLTGVYFINSKRTIKPRMHGR
ncbi:drug/metabolite transporter (DMT)-like permease [Mariniflexile fucanivorans]|uniref:Drug/metabolite transporter (DMT)-like permease n=1 Tax=Mariniflexile fucanivorans TaxID=264023 RepID=A0A4R1RGR9_9FLAO|nr:EamA family transporter [Mariniflexile fucanivorans]TCL64910.1 drug/metabolite transporter (DMT)-like permease [Mariniflexile fucanivorans]